MSSCARQETVCECVNNNSYNGKKKNVFILSKRRLDNETALAECAKWQETGNGTYDTCLVKIIK
ncbi:hypothetical protein GCM10023093_03270 [Nemorincola caseinilytica]|uniref:Uncharacterized protein n=1 Tax=Nemorincola caseinilytica TaxID=2054315 RepID=A0ABP8N7E8_9BACT